MPPIPRRLVANAVAARLLSVTNSTGYYGQIGRLLPGAPEDTPVDPQPKSALDPRVQPYFVFYPGAGGRGPDPDAGDQAVDLTQSFDVTAAAGDIEDLLALIDRIDTALLRWSPDLARDDVAVGCVRRPPGVPDTASILTDTQHSPHRLYARLQYQLTATT